MDRGSPKEHFSRRSGEQISLELNLKPFIFNEAKVNEILLLRPPSAIYNIGIRNGQWRFCLLTCTDVHLQLSYSAPGQRSSLHLRSCM